MDQYPSKMDGPPPAYPHHEQYPQSQLGYPYLPQVEPSAPQQPQQVITTVITPPSQLGYRPQRMTCPFCQADMSTDVKYDSGIMTHIIAFVLCIFGCFCGCCCIPYCVEGCKDAQHNCSSCKRMIGIAKRLR